MYDSDAANRQYIKPVTTQTTIAATMLLASSPDIARRYTMRVGSATKTAQKVAAAIQRTKMVR
jgi:hypothetical protein